MAACVVEGAQVEVCGDPVLGDLLLLDGEEHGAQVGHGTHEEAGQLEDDALEDGRAAAGAGGVRGG